MDGQMIQSSFSGDVNETRMFETEIETRSFETETKTTTLETETIILETNLKTETGIESNNGFESIIFKML